MSFHPLSAQKKNGFGLTGGIKIGINFADLTGPAIDELNQTKQKSGLAIGGFLTIKLSDMFALQPELLYSQKGAKRSDNWGQVTWTNYYDLVYVDVPLLFKIFIPTKSQFRPNLFIGPFLSFALSGKWEIDNGGTSEVYDFHDMKNMDFGIVIGSGIDIPLGSQVKLCMDIRFCPSLTQISKLADVDSYTTILKSYNSVFSFLMGIGF